MKRTKLFEINDYLTTNTGIFKAIYTNHSTTFTWLTETIANTLDLDYYLNHSYNKYISRMCYLLYENDNTTYLSRLAQIIAVKFADKWNKIYNAYIASDYNPLHNYDMVEDEYTNTNVTVSTDANDNVYGFNTTDEDGVESSKSGASSTTTGDFDDNHRQLTRAGNIGVMTTEDLLHQEIELRMFNFYHMLMDDIDTVMCLDIQRLR